VNAPSVVKPKVNTLSIVAISLVALAVTGTAVRSWRISPWALPTCMRPWSWSWVFTPELCTSDGDQRAAGQQHGW